MLGILWYPGSRTLGRLAKLSIICHTSAFPTRKYADALYIMYTGLCQLAQPGIWESSASCGRGGAVSVGEMTETTAGGYWLRS